MFLEALVPIVALIMVFGPGFYWVKRRFDLKELKERQGSANPKLLEAHKAERAQLEERIRNLESIVTSVDFELNRRIARLAAEQSRMTQALPAPAAATADGVIADDPAKAVTVAADERGFEELRVGEAIADRYHIQRLLGRGGMGAVYLAQDKVLDELVALKVVSAMWAADAAEVSDRFRREATAARKVSSPNVIRIHDLGQTRDGLLYISMEYFAGKTLAELLAQRGTLPLEDNRDIVGQICTGLEAAHAAGVTHRDLKPANVLVGERQAVKLIDFGLATATFFQGMTATGLSLGTPEYMSPEQVRGRNVDARSDIYSLGALMYHAVTGRPPFSGDSPIAIGFAHCSHEPRPPAELRPDLAPPLNAAILGALAKTPAERPSLADIRAAL